MPTYTVKLNQARLLHCQYKVRRVATIWNWYNQVPHLAQDTNRKVTKTQPNVTNKSQDVSPFPTVDHKAAMNRRENMKHTRHKNTNDPQKKCRLGTVSKISYWRACMPVGPASLSVESYYVAALQLQDICLMASCNCHKHSCCSNMLTDWVLLLDGCLMGRYHSISMHVELLPRNSACLLALCFSISMVSNYQPCLLVCSLTIGHALWCGVYLSTMSGGVVPHYRSCLLVCCLTVGHAF